MGQVLPVRRQRVSMTGHFGDPVPAVLPFWPKPVSIFGLFIHNDVYQEFACANHTIHPGPLSAVMLAEVPSPRGSGAALVGAWALSEGF